MKENMTNEQFLSLLSDRLTEKGFSVHMEQDGSLLVESDAVGVSRKSLCAIGEDGEVYCNSEDLLIPLRKEHLETVIEMINEVYAEMEHVDAVEQESMGGMSL